jgi:hypothetical protein
MGRSRIVLDWGVVRKLSRTIVLSDRFDYVLSHVFIRELATASENDHFDNTKRLAVPSMLPKNRCYWLNASIASFFDSESPFNPASLDESWLVPITDQHTNMDNWKKLIDYMRDDTEISSGDTIEDAFFLRSRAYALANSARCDINRLEGRLRKEPNVLWDFASERQNLPNTHRTKHWAAALRMPSRYAITRFGALTQWMTYTNAAKDMHDDNLMHDYKYLFFASYFDGLATEDKGIKSAAQALFPKVRLLSASDLLDHSDQDQNAQT